MCIVRCTETNQVPVASTTIVSRCAHVTSSASTFLSGDKPETNRYSCSLLVAPVFFPNMYPTANPARCRSTRPTVTGLVKQPLVICINDLSVCTPAEPLVTSVKESKSGNPERLRSWYSERFRSCFVGQTGCLAFVAIQSTAFLAELCAKVDMVWYRVDGRAGEPRTCRSQRRSLWVACVFGLIYLKRNASTLPHVFEICHFWIVVHYLFLAKSHQHASSQRH